LIVNDIFLGQDMKNFAVSRNRNGLGRLKHAVDIELANLFATYCNDPVTVEPGDVRATY
jgi:hypothetical protein